MTEWPFYDRRKCSRVYRGFPAVVRGLNVSGNPFEHRTFLVNLSASGMYFSLSDVIPLGNELYAVVELSSASRANRSTILLAAQGVVVRAESWMDGAQGFAVRFDKHQVL